MTQKIKIKKRVIHRANTVTAVYTKGIEGQDWTLPQGIQFCLGDTGNPLSQGQHTCIFCLTVT